ncbi:MAG: hypothetical protein Q4B32_03915 [Clostridia bacterium]|nr:hypothetical protein [Clostridia bacterium]
MRQYFRWYEIGFMISFGVSLLLLLLAQEGFPMIFFYISMAPTIFFATMSTFAAAVRFFKQLSQLMKKK